MSAGEIQKRQLTPVSISQAATNSVAFVLLLMVGITITSATKSQASTLTSNEAIRIGVGEKTTLQGTELSAKTIRFVNTSAANGGSGQGELLIGASVNTTQTAHTEKTETAGMWQEMKGNGQTVQSANLTRMRGQVQFDEGLSITVQTPVQAGVVGNTPAPNKGDTLVAALSPNANANNTDLNALIASEPTAAGTTKAQATLNSVSTPVSNAVLAPLNAPSGLEYLDQLKTRPGVKWTEVELAKKQWRYEQAGLTPAGAAVVTIAVAMATSGAGAALAGGTAATTTSAATLMGSTTLAAATSAGFSAMASMAAVSLANNGGDIGKTLEQLGREESIKSIALAMVTAGALNKLGGKISINGTNLNDIALKDGFYANALKNAINNSASAAIDAAINGKPFDENTLSKALSSALITAGAAQGAERIGDAQVKGDLNAFTHKVAHAALGCAAGSATTGSTASGCAAGAVGAVVGELTAEYAKGKGMNNTDTLNLAKVMAGVAGVIAGGGGDNAQAVNVASTAGGNAAQNNYLKHAERLALANAQKACFADAASAACGTVVALQIKDQLSDKLLSNAAASCKGAECNDVTNFIQSQMSSLGCTAPSACPDYNTLSSYLRVAQEKAQGLEPVYPEGWVLDAKAALDLGKFGVKLLPGAAGSKGSLDALGQLAKTDATTATNNFYRDGSNPAYWTNGKPGDASLNLATHWEKHGAEFPNFSSANDYYRGATDFVTTPPPGTLVKTAPNGDVLLYNPATNTFGVRTADGLPKTMFRPDDGMSYWTKQRGQ